MEKKKLHLDDIKVKSFKTSKETQVKGGAPFTQDLKCATYVPVNCTSFVAFTLCGCI